MNDNALSIDLEPRLDLPSFQGPRWLQISVEAGHDLLFEEKFLNDFVAVWNKVMNLDRFDLD